MAWDFSTDPEWEEQLDWVRALVHDEVEPLDTFADQLDWEAYGRITAPLKERVKARGLWAAHLGPELGGPGFGQVKLALMHEILGRTPSAPVVFGNQAPDSGNAELLAIGADEAQQERWLRPLLDGTKRSSFALTEPFNAGSDPTNLSTVAVRDGDEWVIDGHKWFASMASVADFVIVMVVTSPDAEPHRRASMIVVERDTPGMEIVRDVGTMAHPYGAKRVGGHAEIRFTGCRVPGENLVGAAGDGFVLAQQRLGGGRIHHAMRWIGQCRRAFDMMCERAVSRQVRGRRLGDQQMVQDMIATSATEIEAARLLTLQAAWRMDRHGAKTARVDIAMIKWFGAQVLYNVLDRAIQVHGALGYSTDLPLEEMYRVARSMRLADGADEVHKVTIARDALKRYEPVDGWPSEHIPTRRAAALERFGALLDAATLNR